MKVDKSVSVKLSFELHEIVMTPAETGLMEDLEIGSEIDCYAYLAGYGQLIKVSERGADTLFLIGMPPNLGIVYDSPQTTVKLKKLSEARFELQVTYSTVEQFRE